MGEARRRLTNQEVEIALGFSPCVCGKIDGSWHPECYRGKTKEQLAAGYKKAMANARRYLSRHAKEVPNG